MSMSKSHPEKDSERTAGGRAPVYSESGLSQRRQLEFYRLLSKNPFYPSQEDLNRIAHRLVRLWK